MPSRNQLRARGVLKPALRLPFGAGRPQSTGALAASTSALAILAGLSAAPANAGQLPASAFQPLPANPASIVPGPFALYTVNTNQLMPTQLNVGFAEVDHKAAGFNILTSASALSADLLADIEPVVIGPGGVLYQTDGHHTFLALLDSAWGSTNPTVDVNVIANYSNLTTAQFFAQMEASNLLYPVNDGVLQTVNFNTGAPLPSSLLGMTSDIYRGLEYSILKNKNSKLFTTTSNITGAAGSTVPGLDKTNAFYSDFIWADAYRGANGGLGLPTLSPADIAIATNWNLNPNSRTTLPNASGGMTSYLVSQLPGFILPSGQNINITGTISNSTLANGTLDASVTGTFNETSTFASFNGLRGLNLGSVTIGADAPGFVMQLGNDLGGTVTLSGNNTYTGGTTILAGTLIVTSDASLGAAAPSNPTITPSTATANVEAANGIIFNSLTEGNGTLQIGATATPGVNSFTSNRPIAVDSEVANINLNGNTLTLTGQIVSTGALSTGIGNATGESDLTVEDNSTAANGVLVLPSTDNNPNFFGNWIITSGTLNVSSDASLGNTTGPSYEIGQIELNGGTFQAGASFSSVRSLFLGGGSDYDTNGFATSFSGSLTDVQRTLTVENTKVGTAGSVAFGSLIPSATATINPDAIGAGTSVSVTFTNGIVRQGAATVILNPNSGTLGGVEKVFNPTATSTLQNGVAPAWMIVDSGGSASTNPYDFLTYNSTNGYVTATYNSSNIATAGATSIVKQSTNATLAANAQAFDLNLQNGKTITATGHTLTLGDGADPAGLILEGSTAINGGTLAFGGSEGVVWTKGTNTITSAITGSGGLTIAGSGTLVVNTASTETGAITVDSGTLTLGAVNTFSSAAPGILLSNVKSHPSAAILTVNANNTLSALNSVGSNSTVNIGTGAILTIGDSQNLNSTLSSTITSTSGTAGALTKNGTGLLDISGASVSFKAGDTVLVNAGELRIGNGVFSTSATTPIVLASGTELQYSGNGGSVFNDPIQGAGTFNLIAGTVKLTGTNTYTGGTVLQIGTTLDTTTASLPTGGNIINAGGIVDFDQNTNGTFTGVISNGAEAGGAGDPNDTNALATGPVLAGNLIKDDSSSNAITSSNSTLTLAAVQTYTGYTAVEAGTLVLGVANAIASSSGVDLGRVGGAQMAGGSAQAATLSLGANQTLQALTSEADNNTFVLLNGFDLAVTPAAGLTSTFLGNISDTGTGNLTVAGTGNGAFVLDGTNKIGGATTVSGGILQVGDANSPGASLTSPGGVTVGASGALEGDGKIVGNVTNSAGGVVAPGAPVGTLTITGNYVQGANSTLLTQVSSSGAAELAVTGGASLSGALQVQPLNGFVPSLGTSYTILNAGGGVTGMFTGLVEPNLGTEVLQPVYGSSTISLVAAQTLGSFGATPNERAVGTVLDEIRATPDATLQNALGTLYSAELSNPAATQAELAQLSPQNVFSQSFFEERFAGMLANEFAGRTAALRAGATGFSVSSSSLGVAGLDGMHDLVAELAQAPSGASDGHYGYGGFAPGSPLGGFVSGQLVFGDRTFVVGGPDNGFTTGGVTVGVDYRVATNSAIGIGGSYFTGTVDAPSGSTDGHGGAISLYGTTSAGATYLDGFFGGGFANLNTTRTLTVGGATSTGTASPDGNFIAFAGDVGHDFDQPWGAGLLHWGPVGEIRYDHTNVDGYTETGLGSLSATVLPRSVNSFQTGLGFEASTDWDTGVGIVTPRVRATWQHEFMDTTETAIANLSVAPGLPFTVTSSGLGRNFAAVTAGLSTRVAAGVTLSADYTGEVGQSNQTVHQILLLARVAF